MEGIRQLARLKTIRRVLRARPVTLLLSLFVTVFFLFLLQWVYSIPPPKFGPQTHTECRDGKEGYVLRNRAVCTDTCGALCFPRVRGICFGNSQVTLCDDDESQTYSGLPNEMRFDMEKHRKKVPVRNGFCPGWDTDRKKPDGNEMNARWIHGLHMVADLTLMPYGKAGPNPHHESEKIIPAILMSQLYDLKNATLYWFANPRDPTSISVWSKGLLKVFASQMKVEYLRPAMVDESPICFEDAIIFASMTNAAYIPNRDAHDWLRQKVLTHCKIPIVNARKPLSDAVVIQRPYSSRNIVNFEEMQAMLERELHIPVKVAETGPREFCQQVRLVAEADFLLTPHGSQNVAVLFSRPNAVILEVFPLLYYVDWLGNLLRTGRMHHYELYGTWTTERLGMPFRMRLYALLVGWKRCFYVRQCMNYGKTQKIFVDLEQLQDILHTLTSSCRVVVHGSRCLTSLVSNRTIFAS
ncbi:hypothetical protein SUGI_0016590 [Cryptomeria japonica]|nr:hypothetical protein SUGI_0016590 [Cryptomeria japonica]